MRIREYKPGNGKAQSETINAQRLKHNDLPVQSSTKKGQRGATSIGRNRTNEILHEEFTASSMPKRPKKSSRKAQIDWLTPTAVSQAGSLSDLFYIRDKRKVF